jgi:NTP pyrophosphatase (non-canonical NTP hydrolase)
MVSLYDVIQARRRLSAAGFPDPGLLSSAIYTFGETSEVLDLVHLELRPGDLRARGKEIRDGIDKELGQVVFMAFTTLAHCGKVMANVEYDRREPKYSNLVIAMQMCGDAHNAMEGANKGNTRMIENAMTEVIAWAYLLGQRYNVDLEKAMWAWVAERKEEAEKSRGAKR